MDWLTRTLPPLSSLRIFESAARLQGFSKAADELGLTQAAISRSIKTLEDDLGVALFVRRNRAVFLTPDGQTYSDAISSALSAIATASQSLRRQKDDSEITFFSQLCEGIYWVMPRLASFHAVHPDIQVKVSASTHPVTESNEPFDVALQISSRAHGTYRPVFTVPDHTFPVCSPEYAEKHEAKCLNDLNTMTLLHHTAQPQDWLTWKEWLAGVGSDIDPGRHDLIFDSYPMMVEATIAGHGVMLGWQRTCQHLLESGVLVRPFAEHLEIEKGLTVYRHAAAPPRPQAQTFLAWLRDEFEAQDVSRTS